MCRADRSKCFVADSPARRGILRYGSSDHDFGLGFPRHLTNPLGPCREFISHITPWQPTAVPTSVWVAHKSERASSLARPRPPYSDIQRSGSGSGSQRLLPRIHSVPTSRSPRFPHSSTITLAARTFLPPSLFQLPGPSLVADPRRRLLVRSLLWKISLPLKAILLSSNKNARGSHNFLLWKWPAVSGKT